MAFLPKIFSLSESETPSMSLIILTVPSFQVADLPFGHGGVGGITYKALYGFTYGAMPATLYDETKGVTYDPTSLPQIKKDVGLTYGHASTPLDPGSGGGGFGAGCRPTGEALTNTTLDE